MSCFPLLPFFRLVALLRDVDNTAVVANEAVVNGLHAVKPSVTDIFLVASVAVFFVCSNRPLHTNINTFVMWIAWTCLSIPSKHSLMKCNTDRRFNGDPLGWGLSPYTCRWISYRRIGVVPRTWSQCCSRTVVAVTLLQRHSFVTHVSVDPGTFLNNVAVGLWCQENAAKYTELASYFLFRSLYG